MQFELSHPFVKKSGRILSHQDIPYLGFSGSFVSFKFCGTKVAVTIISDCDQRETIYNAWFEVYLNGETTPFKRFCLHSNKAEYTLYESKIATEVTIQLVRLTESQYATSGISFFSIDGELLPMPEVSYNGRIEFIGDSITCGFGNEAPNAETEFTTAQENATTAYAVLTAHKLNLEYHLVSHSGIGILSSWTVQDVPSDSILMPQFYPYTDFDTSNSLGLSNPPLWNFEEFQPDIIVVNLGTNDNSYTKGIKERVTQFGDRYEQFLTMVRSFNPKAQIICSLGIVGDQLFSEINERVEHYKEVNQDDRVATFHFPMQRMEDGIGACSHPSNRTHEKMADLLAKEIEKYLAI